MRHALRQELWIFGDRDAIWEEEQRPRVEETSSAWSDDLGGGFAGGR